jgi:DNA invertase Pin-like site-specific DNA recombinase
MAAALAFVRQSSLYQVANNTPSARRQYDLRGRTVALGWSSERVIVIDVDQGHSGASSIDRAGFQRLVADVSLGKAGIVLGVLAAGAQQRRLAPAVGAGLAVEHDDLRRGRPL